MQVVAPSADRRCGGLWLREDDVCGQETVRPAWAAGGRGPRARSDLCPASISPEGRAVPDGGHIAQQVQSAADRAWPLRRAADARGVFRKLLGP
jgi:hypothetical protein